MAYDSTLVVYTGISTANIPVTPGQSLQTIIQNIDGKLGSIAAPNYSGYDLACITQVDGVSHPTNTQNFAEGISKIVCDNAEIMTTFIETTYVNDQEVLTDAINSLAEPALTYAPFSITTADNLNTVFTKMFTGFTGYNTALNPSTAGWSTLGITSPTTVTNGFAALITYIDGMVDDIAAKEDSIGTFDNESNCLAGSAEDTAKETIDLLTTYICTLPTFDADAITTTCMTGQDTLQDWVQHLVDTVDGIMGDYVARAGTGLLLAAGTGCDGKSLAIDPTYIGLRKVGVAADDSTYGYLEDKLVAGDGIELATVTDGGITKIEVTNSAPYEGKVRISQYDTVDGYLMDKLTANVTDWGLSLSVRNDSSNNKVFLTPEVVDADLLAEKVMDTVLGNSSLIAKFKQIMDSTTDDSGDANPATGLTVVIK